MDPYRRLGGNVTEVLPLTGRIRVAVDRGDIGDEASLIGKVIHFSNERHRSAHTIRSARREGNSLLLGVDDDLFVGCAEVDQVEPRQVHTATAMPLALSLRGAMMTDEMFHWSRTVDQISDGNIKLVKALPQNQGLKAGDRIWLIDVGVGDRAEIPFVEYKH
jgi:hypothetical protein